MTASRNNFATSELTEEHVLRATCDWLDLIAVAVYPPGGALLDRDRRFNPPNPYTWWAKIVAPRPRLIMNEHYFATKSQKYPCEIWTNSTDKRYPA